MTGYRDGDLLSDRRLLGDTRVGRAECFEVVYRRHHRVVLAFLARRVAEPELAADLMAETFAALLVLVRDRKRAIPEAPVAWLLATARHLLIDSYRRGVVEDAARRRLAMGPVALEDSDLQRIQDISAETNLLEVLAAQLPAEQFTALRARVIDERDYPSIAEELRCSQAVIRKRVSRALHILRTSWENKNSA